MSLHAWILTPWCVHAASASPGGATCPEEPERHGHRAAELPHGAVHGVVLESKLAKKKQQSSK